MNLKAKYVFQVSIKILLATILLSFFSACNELSKNDTNRVKTVDELILEMITGSKNLDSIAPIITNLIINDSVEFIYTVSNYFDYRKNIGLLKISKQKVIPEHYHYECFECFEICIINKDTVYINGMLSNLDTLLIQQLKYHYSIKNQDIMESSNDIDDNMMGEIVIEIGVNSKGINSNNAHFVWSYFFNSIEYILCFYDELCNEASLEKFDTKFLKLAPVEKKAIIDDIPFQIIINFNMVYCSTLILPSQIE